jgi:hypothetical protein
MVGTLFFLDIEILYCAPNHTLVEMIHIHHITLNYSSLLSWRSQTVTRMCFFSCLVYLSNFLDCRTRYSSVHSSSFGCFREWQQELHFAFSSSHFSMMLAIISLPSLWIVVFVFRAAIMCSDDTLHMWLKSAYGNSAAVHIHHTPYCNICTKHATQNSGCLCLESMVSELR